MRLVCAAQTGEGTPHAIFGSFSILFHIHCRRRRGQCAFVIIVVTKVGWKIIFIFIGC